MPFIDAEKLIIIVVVACLCHFDSKTGEQKRPHQKVRSENKNRTSEMLQANDESNQLEYNSNNTV